MKKVTFRVFSLIVVLLGLSLSSLLLAGEKAPGEKTKGIDNAEYKVQVEVKNGGVRISTIGKSGYHCNTLYPWKLTVLGKDKKETVFKKTDAKLFSEENVVFEVPSKKAAPLEATLKLSVCNDQQCIMKTEKLKL